MLSKEEFVRRILDGAPAAPKRAQKKAARRRGRGNVIAAGGASRVGPASSRW